MEIERTKSQADDRGARRLAIRFVLLIGCLSFFADFTYEGSRSILGPYLGGLGASATIVGIVTGLGEFLGYGLRLVSGRWADATGLYWPTIICGYAIQMTSVPALALTRGWETAAVLIILERVGKAMRNPPRDAMLAHAAKHVGGYGSVFGIHEALDQLGAMFGPLLVAFVLARGGNFQAAFAVLVVPAAINLALVAAARALYPRPADLEASQAETTNEELPKVFWLYLGGAALVAAGFADYPLIAYHFGKAHTVTANWTAIFYAVAMAVSGSASLFFGPLFDRFGFTVLVGLTFVSSLFAPLVFLGGFWTALLGAAIWGMGMGVHESIIPAAVAPMIAIQQRATAFGTFTAGYGLFWFLGSSVMGALYDRSLAAMIAFSLISQLAAVPIFAAVKRRWSKMSG